MVYFELLLFLLAPVGVGAVERTKAILDQASDRLFPKTVQACLEALGEKGASPGQLSVAETDAGQLSLATDEAGQLSFATDTAGQLSLGSTGNGRKPGREGAA